ncbi:MAG: hypothetical protein ACXQS6_00100 [Candidatus Syntropharchaeales archaeon]
MLIFIICSGEPALARGVKALVVEEGETMTIEADDLFIGENITIEPDATLILKNTSIRRWKNDSTAILMETNATLIVSSSVVNASTITGSSMKAIQITNSSIIANEIQIHATEIRSVSSTIDATNLTGEGRVVEFDDAGVQADNVNLASVFMNLEGSEIISSKIDFICLEYLNINDVTLTGDVTIGSIFSGGDPLIQISDAYLDWSNLTVLGDPVIPVYNTLEVVVKNATHEPVEGREVLILDENDDIIGDSTTDKNGSVSFNLLATTIYADSVPPTFLNYTVETVGNSTSPCSLTMTSPLSITLLEKPLSIEPANISRPTVIETFDRWESIENETSNESSRSDRTEDNATGDFTRRAMGFFLTKSFIVMGAMIGGILGTIALVIKRLKGG